MVTRRDGIFMRGPTGPARPHRTAAGALVAAALMTACATGTPGAATGPLSDAQWRALARPRPAPLSGAARVSIAEVQLAGSLAWRPELGLTAELGVEELAVAGLLRRRDVQFVERRRFAAAAEAERAGIPRPADAPPAGVSPGAEYVITAAWLSVGPGRGAVDVRLADARTGGIASTARTTLDGDPDPVALARSIVAGVLDALGQIGRRPAWEDPNPRSGGSTSSSGVSQERLASFVRGVALETTWRWEEARRSYESAATDPSFYEATAALARAARLRSGGTLGES